MFVALIATSMVGFAKEVKPKKKEIKKIEAAEACCTTNYETSEGGWGTARACTSYDTNTANGYAIAKGNACEKSNRKAARLSQN